MIVRQYLMDLRGSGRLVCLLALALFILWSHPATSHHSFTSLLTPDGEESLAVIEGSVRVFRILNPHGALIVDAKDDSGNVEGWLIELSPAAQLSREGWSEDNLGPGDAVTVAIFPSVTPQRARLRAMLVHGKAEGEPAQLFVSYGIRGDTPVMRRLKERLPVCGTIDSSYQRTECFLVDAEAASALAEEFPGEMGYVMP
jgi:hypothetical protein